MGDATEDHDPQSVSRLITSLAESGRHASDEEILQIRNHVAEVGFEAGAVTKAGSRLVGHVWNGQLVQSNDRLSNTVVHYLRHVVAQGEWPSGTTVDEYIASLQSAVEDPDGGVFLNRRYSQWLLTFVAQIIDHKGFVGRQWVAVGYGVNYGYWMTGYRPRTGLDDFLIDAGEEARWLRRPRNQSE